MSWNWLDGFKSLPEHILMAAAGVTGAGLGSIESATTTNLVVVGATADRKEASSQSVAGRICVSSGAL